MITVNDEYRIVSDSYCWILQKKQGKNKRGIVAKKEKWVSILYNRDLQIISKWLVDNGIKESFTDKEHFNSAVDDVASALKTQVQAVSDCLNMLPLMLVLVRV